jgi:hypothetical protein
LVKVEEPWHLGSEQVEYAFAYAHRVWEDTVDLRSRLLSALCLWRCDLSAASVRRSIGGPLIQLDAKCGEFDCASVSIRSVARPFWHGCGTELSAWELDCHASMTTAPQVRRHVRLSVGARQIPLLTLLSGTQRARMRFDSNCRRAPSQAAG